MLNFLKRSATPSLTDNVGKFVVSWVGHTKRTEKSKQVFVLDGAKISDAEMGSPSAMLPLFLWHASNVYNFGVPKARLGVEFSVDEDALLKRSVSADRVGRATSEVLLFVLEALEDAHKHLPRNEAANGAVELRGLVNQFAADMGMTPQLTVAPAATGARPQV